MELSIIVPIYNTPRYMLKRCFESINAINSVSFECILIDDGSRKEVGEFCRCFVEEHKRFVYFWKENGGVSSARNLGMQLAQGRFVCFVDSDDEIVSDSFDVASFFDTKADLIATDLLVVENEKKTVWKAFDQPGEICYEQAVRRLTQDGRWNGPVCKFFRKAFVQQNSLRFPLNMVHGEDAVFLCNALEKRPHIVYEDIITYIYHHSYVEGGKRFLRFPKQCLKDASAHYRAVIQCILQSNYCSDEKQDLIRARKNAYIGELFNRMLDCVEHRIFSDDLRQEFRAAAESIIDDETSNLCFASQIKLKATEKANLLILQTIVLLRCIRYKIKGLR